MCPVVSPHFYNVRTSEVSPNDVRHDDSFLGFRPTVSARYPEAVAMRYRILNVGKGSSNDVDLERFGHCNNISARHAIIFYDEVSGIVGGCKLELVLLVRVRTSKGIEG